MKIPISPISKLNSPHTGGKPASWNLAGIHLLKGLRVIDMKHRTGSDRQDMPGMHHIAIVDRYLLIPPGCGQPNLKKAGICHKPDLTSLDKL